MTFPTIRLPFIVSFSPTNAPQTTARCVHHADVRCEYVERLLSSDACSSEYGVQALMGLFPRDF